MSALNSAKRVSEQAHIPVHFRARYNAGVSNMTKDRQQFVGAPKAQGLYDPAFEHDSCGVGFVVDMKGRKSHDIIQGAYSAEDVFRSEVR